MGTGVVHPQRHKLWPRKASLEREADQLQRLPLPSRNVRKLDGIQMLRAFAVASVAWLHAGQMTQKLRSGRPLPDLGISGVDLFFVISGFILCLLTLRDKQQTPGLRTSWNFLQRRIARIFPIYWIFGAPMIVHWSHHGWQEAKSYLPGLFLLPSYSYPDLKVLANFGWTLVFEMFFYLALAVILLVTVRRAPQVLIGTLVLFIAAGELIGIHRPLLNVMGNPMLLEFAFGGAVALLYSRIGSGYRFAGSLVVGLGCAGLALLAATNWSWIAPFPYQILRGEDVLARALTWGLSCALLVAGVVLLGPSLQSAFGKISVILGNASYSTYLLSGFALPLLDRQFIAAAARHVSVSVWTAGALQTGIVAALLLVGVIFYQLVERPLIQWSYRLLSGESPR